ncbi:MAG: TonB family protein [Acidobacteria bacterium]|nr:TonB family protein [Acidobacteriota bacterium]
MTIALLFLVGALSTSQAPAAAPPGSEAHEAALAAAVAKRPTAFVPYRDLARIYAKTGRRDDAERILRQALAVHRDSGAVFAALVSLHSEPRDPHKQLAVAEEWTKAEPTKLEPLIVAARAHSELASAATDPVDRADHMERAKRASEEAGAIMTATKGAAPQGTIVQGAQMRSSTARAAFPNAIRVGGAVRLPRKIKDVKPEMPPAAIEARVQGVVIMEIVIDESGAVADAKILRSIPLLDAAALEAVKQWQFEPTELEGRRVPVIITVTVQFTTAPGSR